MNMWLSCEITLKGEMRILIIMEIMCGIIENGGMLCGIDNCGICISIQFVVTNFELSLETFALRKEGL